MAFAFRIERISRWLPTCVVVVLGSSLPCAAWAQTTADDPRIEAGHRLLQANECDAAATAFRTAWDAGRRPRALAELGLAEACLSRWVDAETNLSQALATPDEWVTRNRASLSESLDRARGRLATLIVEVVGPSADETEVFVDGRVRGRPGQDLRVVAGAIIVEVRAAGFETGRRNLDVPASQRSRERFELSRVAAAPRTDTRDAPSDDEPEDRPTRRRRATRDTGSTQRTLAWIGLGAAGIGVGVGVGGLVLRESNIGTWNDDAVCNSVPGMDRDQECPDEGDAWRTGETIMWVGFIGGGLLAAGSVLLLLTAPSSEPEPESRFAIGCAPISGGAGCSLRVW